MATKPGRSWRKPLATLLTITVLLAVAAWASGTLGAVPILLSRHELALRNDHKAAYWLDIAESLNGDRSEISLSRARVARRSNDLDEMEKQLRDAIASGGDSKAIDRERTLALAQTGRIDRVIGEIEQWMVDPGNDVADLADAYSTALQQKGRTNEAKVVLNVWIADCPSDPRPHLQWAQIAETELTPELAQQHYDLAMEKNPNYPALLYSYGRFLLMQKQPTEAAEVLQSCLEVAPNTAPAIKPLLAASHRLLGNRDVAFELLEDAIAIRQEDLMDSFLRLSAVPEPGEAEFELGRLYFDEGNFEQAETYFRKASELSPDHFDAERQLGLTLQRLGRDSEAATVMERVDQKRKELADIAPFLRRINAMPEDFDARYQVAMILLRNGREERAIEYFDGVLIDAPDHEPTHQRLFEIYSRKSLTETEFSRLAAHHRQVLERLNQGTSP